MNWTPKSARSETTRMCHVCDAETCKDYNVKKATPRVRNSNVRKFNFTKKFNFKWISNDFIVIIVLQNCSVELLQPENGGPSKLSQMADTNFLPMADTNPQFSCQKIEGTDVRTGIVNIVRRCQLKFDANNQACEMFLSRVREDRENTFKNVSCTVCDDRDGCNGYENSYICISLLLGSTIISSFNIFNVWNVKFQFFQFNWILNYFHLKCTSIH